MADGKVEIDVTADVTDAKRKIDELTGKVDEMAKRGEESGERTASAFDRLKGVGATVGKALATGAAVAGTAVLGIGTAALNSYAQYEQLVGGVDTLFGSASGKLQQYASDAYRTAGMSANQYMEQATSFSASLVQGLKEDGRSMEEVYSMAADSANMAMTDMADNVNKMGSSMTDVQNAYQGFAKDNYTMLDNLKLGYGGTQSEMARLINDSGVLGDTIVDANSVSSVSFDKIIEAIHVTQERMGITGTTAKEAMGTIQGSIEMTKAAWDNWLTGLADPNADMGALTDQLLEALGAVAGNVAPRVAEIGQAILDNLPGALAGAAAVLGPVLADALSAAWNGAVAALGQAGIQLPPIDASQVTAALEGVRAALQWFADNGSAVVSAIAGIAGGMVAFQAATSVAGIVQGVVTAVKAFRTATEAATAAQVIFNAVMAATGGPFVLIATVIGAVVAALVVLWTTNEGFRNAVTAAWEAVSSAVGGAVEAVGGFMSGLLENVSGIGEAIATFFTETVPQAFQALVDWFANLPTAIGEALTAAMEALGAWLSALPATISTWLASALTAVAEWAVGLGAQAMLAGQTFLTNLSTFLTQLPYNIGFLLGTVIGTVVLWVTQFASQALAAGQQFLTNVVTFVTQLPGQVLSFLTAVITNVVSWVGQMASNAQQAGSQFLNNVVDFVTRLPASLWSLLSEAIGKAQNFVSQMGQKAQQAGSDFLNRVVDGIQSLPGRVWGFLSEAIGKAGQFVGDFAAKAMDAARQFADNIVNGIKGIPGQVASIGRDIVDGIAGGIRNAAGSLGGALKGVVDGAIAGVKSTLGIASPSKLFRDEVGRMIPLGAAEGVEGEARAFRSAVDEALAYAPEIRPDLDVFGGAFSASMVADMAPLAEAVRGVGERIDALQGALGDIIATSAPAFPSDRMMGRLVRGWANGTA